MIQASEKARLKCDEPRCKAQVERVSLILLNNGCWGIDPDSIPPKWKIGFERDKIAPYKVLCPDHSGSANLIINDLGGLR